MVIDGGSTVRFCGSSARWCRVNLVELWIPGTFPNLNDMLAAKGLGARGLYSQMKREQQKRVTDLLALVKPQPFQRARVSFRWVEKDRRRDPDNVSAAQKFILDALVAAGVLLGDGWKCIAGLSHTFEVNQLSPGVHVRVEEAT